MDSCLAYNYKIAYNSRMREGFESGIAAANEAVKSENEELLAEMAANYEHDFGGEEATEKIIVAQEQKAAIMDELRDTLAQIDEVGTVGIEGQMRSVSYDGEDMFVFGKGGVAKQVSEGQLLVAGMWDEEYFLDPAIPRKFKKQYAVAKAKYQLAELYDYQIALAEANQSYNKNTGLDEAYAAVAVHHEQAATIPDGIIAERMVESFLTKLAHDYELPYRVKNVTVYEDVEYKIDFIIEPTETDKSYGVGVEEPAHRPDIAIQFTTAKSERTIEHKERQIDRAKARLGREGGLDVSDLVLITLPIEHVRDTYEAWIEQKPGKRVPGGPDELWSVALQEEVFMGLLKDVLPPGVAKESWQQCKRY